MVLLISGCGSKSIRDVDGNSYRTVKIGRQVWLAGNLKTTHFNDGTPIPQVMNFDSWAGLTIPAYSWYNNEIKNKELYGALYNWYAVNTNKLCPAGWHVPADWEWITLRNNLSGSINAGGNLKATGTAFWRSPNTGATNESGFTALPGGYRSYKGPFNYMKISANFWSTSGQSQDKMSFWNISYKSRLLNNSISEKGNGFSVRCIKDK